MNKIQIGDIAISTVLESDHTLFDAEAFFPDATPELFEKECSWMAPGLFDRERNSIICTIQGYVFRAGGLNVLVDTCVGNDKEGRSQPAWNNAQFPWLDNLVGAGFAPEDIDIVLCTHLHVDHVGWNTRLENGEWVPTFPTAQYLTTAVELENLQHRSDSGPPIFRTFYEDSVLPVIKAGQSVLVGNDHKIADGVCLESLPGHTPDHMGVKIVSGGQTALAIGDAMHHPIQALYPDWNSQHCADGLLASQTRRSLLEEVCDSPVQVLPAHFNPCHVTRRGEEYWIDFG
ncbi:MAG: MBL fold metallo-hydrolase [Rhodospirillales bacterium]|nr:MBL fold metallo-hydrolase [Rhodospirillales bacterium]